jgi:hypothetical protein
MDSGENGTDRDRPKRVARLAADLADDCRYLKEHHREAAAHYGYAQSVYDVVAKSMGDCQKDSPPLGEIEEGYRRRHKAFAEQRERLQLMDVSSDAYAVGTAAMSIVTVLPIAPTAWLPPPPGCKDEPSQRLKAHLDRIHRDLRPKFDEAWRTLHIGGRDAGRQALATMRSLVDQLIDTLAPRDKVRDFVQSTCDQSVLLNHEGQPLRKAYLLYIASAICPDTERARAVARDAGEFLDVYRDLSTLHAHELIPLEKARNIVRAMQIVLEKWLDLID